MLSISALALPILIQLAITPRAEAASNVTCAKGSNQEWYYNKEGKTPCETFEELYRVCEPSFQMFGIKGGGDRPFSYFCQPDNDPSDFCCCNSVSFALFSACKSCQWGTPPVASTQQTYGTWLGHCSRKQGITITNGSLPANLTTEGLVLPPYSFITPTTPMSVYKWSYSAAQANATAEKSFTTHRSSSGLSAGGKAGVAILVILLVFGGFAAWKWGWPWYQNRRNGGSGGLDFENNRRSTFGFGSNGKTDGGPWREMRDETSHNNGVAPNPKSSFSSSNANPFADGAGGNRQRVEDDAYGGHGGWGSGDGQPYPQAHVQPGQQHVPTHGRDRSFGGGGPNGDGMYPVHM